MEEYGICPSCRETVSVYASRCPHCGEELIPQLQEGEFAKRLLIGLFWLAVAAGLLAWGTSDMWAN